MTLRSPICTVVGHVDHGKSSILDKIRGTAIVATEAGAITQAIGASIIPIDVIKKICGHLLTALKIDMKIPGILFIDTPGHAAFTSLRKRGGNLADIAILVVDINEGFKPQTIEALEILKTSKTPFIVAANKFDLIKGFSSKPGSPILQTIKTQSDLTISEIETKMYELVGKFAEYELQSERFDRVSDYTKQIAIVPVSAKTGEGIPELLMVMSGLTQKFLEKCLSCDLGACAKGTILEVKEEKGLGKTLDLIMYDGVLRVNDTIVIGDPNEPIVTRIKALLEPNPLAEMRDKKAKFKSVKEVFAATGVKISAPDIDNVIAGMPLRSCANADIETVKEEIIAEVKEVLIETDEEGIVIKADSLGSLEALLNMLREKEIPVRKAAVGDISKKDISDAGSNYEQDPLLSVILGFNSNNPNPKSETVKIITNNVIYKLIEDYEAWVEEEKKRMESKELDNLQRPCKVEVMRGYVFRQNNPAVFGISVEVGTLKPGMPMMRIDGVALSTVKGLQDKQERVDKAEKGKQVALSMDHITVGRHVNEGDILITDIPESDFKKLKEFKKMLSNEEIDMLKEIAKIKRETNPVWGV